VLSPRQGRQARAITQLLEVAEIQHRLNGRRPARRETLRLLADRHSALKQPEAAYRCLVGRRRPARAAASTRTGSRPAKLLAALSEGEKFAACTTATAPSGCAKGGGLEHFKAG